MSLASGGKRSCNVGSSLPLVALLLATVCLCLCAGLCTGCAGSGDAGASGANSQVASQGVAEIAERGSITTADGVVLAEMRDVADGQGIRAYPAGPLAAAVTGSCVTQGAPEGIEQRFEQELLAGNDIVLTVDADAQRAAYEALGDYKGAAVVLDPATGAVIALASTPSYDPNDATASEEALANRATSLHIPGSTFKTITLAAALENKVAALDERFDAPAVLAFQGGDVSNYDTMQYEPQTLEQAYEKSINTVFAQLALTVGADGIDKMAQDFGFERDIAADFPLAVSTISGREDMGALMEAWTGVGQALYQRDGSLQGPLMTAVEGASIAAVVENGGTLYQPYVVADVSRASDVPVGESQIADVQVGEPRVLNTGFLSHETIEALTECMRGVVARGTGTSAAVAGVDVGGKTGTAETADGTDDGWFIGFARADGKSFAVAVVIKGAESAEASAVAAEVIGSLCR